eukprot:m.516832 g.516832  ORF g.516832 m.516832 type:complete len:175 (-) comp21933_c0_seq6:1791-2315(-)
MMRVLKGMSATICGAGVGFVAYDYNNRHPMLKSSPYELQSAYLRFHNTCVQPILNRKITIEQLQAHTNKHTGIYFSCAGRVYDASASSMFQDSYKSFAGRDATVALAIMSLNPDDAGRTDWESLSNADWEVVKSWNTYFEQKYPCVATLTEFENTIFSKYLHSNLQAKEKKRSA